MRFTIVKNTGTNQPQQLSYDFIPPGGTIGRSPDNNWVLPDEGQAIARLQAVVSISIDDECRITNRGAAPEILLNTLPMAPDRQIEVRDGDILNIGDYQIQIININPINIHQSAGKPPLATIRSLGTQQIFQELNDHNPLIKTPQQQERNPINPLEHMETMIDLDSLQFRATDPVTMFNADTDRQQENIFTDSTPSTLLQQGKPSDNQDEKQEIDPLVLFSDKPIRRVKNDPPLNNPMLDNAEPLMALDDTVFCNHQYGAKDPPFYSPSERLNIDPIAYSPDPHQVNNVKEEIKLEGKLLAALLDGMGLSHIQSPQFDEDAMYKLGKLLSQLSQGIIALNASRTLLKYETDTGVTQILSDGNNPFKLLPSGQAVLVQMFGDHMPGFMPPEQATRDILVELQAHQLGIIAGLRTVTKDILQPLRPSVIEQKARETSHLPRLSLSSTYKAALWDYFTKDYQRIMIKIEQNAPLLGENFQHSYEAEMTRYRNTQNPSKNKK
ncbi:type VI secretion system-associated FHA domain protein TagH [Xenorhabdus sp. IM139775]|uniref:type VI secretion system-associated FHA domain protein TagH n=1 Tax=Xenorhabdus sp. IM139775 TaxID=3025876 RepID=UPI00235A408C|nr:type VI secretion system-associated FHA domain protein TagH [Xenorhabdus sp. IM139775]MDC9592072.1 type VI secretion system-associated FHA domain protein TagH [Xenorhabdus sp. IM139775]